ncbi:RCC1 domain-containing protein [Legionella cardiaca]|uniref:RCC1-like domain-containing protein n=1 Tax=Legionella cardiaca TaxID=1071983 RepID=A0ABY8AXF5_9GAMM|nr:hypothetical protein [Legionella cardiaca]WED44170.1 hypothetical protein PXX05_05115 [Legionella cardiaca]
MQSSFQKGTILSLPIDIVCYLAAENLDSHSAFNFFIALIPAFFAMENPLTTKGYREEQIRQFLSSSCKRFTEVYKTLLPQKLIAGDGVNFYFSALKGWFFWGENADQFTGFKSDFVQKLTLSLENKTSQLWQKFELNIVDIVSYRSRTFILTKDGKVYHMGMNFPKDPKSNENNASNRKLLSPLQLVKGLESKKIIKLALGGRHILALTDNGQVYSWGWNKEGLLGLGHYENQEIPQLITAFDKIKITNIFAGIYSSFCISEDGKIYAFGMNRFGQLGMQHPIKTSEPTLITFLQDKKIISIACKSMTTLFLSAEGEVFSCGTSEVGELGLGEIKRVSIPTKIESLNDIKNDRER